MSENSNNILYYVRSNKVAPLNGSKISSDAIHNSSVSTETNEFQWPIPHRNVEPEFKWKIVRPKNIPRQRNQIGAKHMIEMNEENSVREMDKTLNGSIETTTNIYPPLTNEQIQSQPFHPYEFESIHSVSNVNTPPTNVYTTYLPDDIYGTAKSENEHHTKDIIHINNEYV